MSLAASGLDGQSSTAVMGAAGGAISPKVPRAVRVTFVGDHHEPDVQPGLLPGAEEIPQSLEHRLGSRVMEPMVVVPIEAKASSG